jgi:hypothetical protein
MIPVQIAQDRKIRLQKRMCKQLLSNLEELGHSSLDGQFGGAATDVSKLFFFFVADDEAE